MAKKVKSIVKLNLTGGAANPGPPAGPALGQHGVAIMDFVNQFNEKTKDQKGDIVPVEITIYEDRSFSFITKKPPVSSLIKKAIGIDKGAEKTGREKAGKLTEKQVEEIAKEKMPDLNTNEIQAAKRIVAGTAKSMGVEIVKS
jgi:large subunit ribosomal protein L11